MRFSHRLSGRSPLCACLFYSAGADPTVSRFIDTGANASAEGGDDDGTEDAAIKVNNIIRSFRLQSTSFDKKGYLAYLKGAISISRPLTSRRR